MENTKQNALSFFSVNLFCDAGCNAAHFDANWNSKGERNQLIMSPSILADIHEGTFHYSEFYLKQTPLSLISDEDAIHIAVLAGWNDGSHKWSTLIQQGKLIATEGYHSVIDEINLSQFTNIVDYLRSQGYALPWAGLSVKQQIEYGWVRLKTE